MQLILENLTGNLLTCPLLGNLTLHHPPPPPPQKKKKKKKTAANEILPSRG